MSSCGVLGDSHSIVNASFFCFSINMCCPFDIHWIQPADLSNPLWGVALNKSFKLFIVFSSVIYIAFVLEPVSDYHVHKAVQQGNIGTGLKLKIYVCILGKLNPSGVCNYKLCSPSLCLLHHSTDNRMVFCCI